ncbi:MAG: CoA ester lyase [Rhodospirillaceae bacterium]|nr:CoA ester lyase [Rhodospirillaceae bacterium]|tara:strand:+ start:2045 stop:2929 length:885 start_codon:yes stop_codon:yes gene_type:complete
MPRTIRPRRSVLYMPGSNARALEKARSLDADGFIFDLEDAVAPDAKEEARKQVCDAVKAGGYAGRELIIRVNGLVTPWGRDDIMQAARSGAHALLLPKVEGAGYIREVLSIMDVAGSPESMAIWCMMETPLAMLHAERIAASSPRLGALVMGTSDLTKDLAAQHTRDRLPMLTSLGICMLAARAFDVSILDGVQLDLENMESFEMACHQGHDMGFDGKTLIHPKQIEAANRIFGPTKEEIAWSERIIDAHTEAAKDGQGVVVVDGKLIENLHIQEAKRILRLAEAINELKSASA